MKARFAQKIFSALLPCFGLCLINGFAVVAAESKCCSQEICKQSSQQFIGKFLVDSNGAQALSEKIESPSFGVFYLSNGFQRRFQSIKSIVLEVFVFSSSQVRDYFIQTGLSPPQKKFI